MSTPYFQLVGHVALTVHAWETNEDVQSALQAQGLDQDWIGIGQSLAETGEELPDRRIEEVGDERITEHGVHSSATEVEMWMQTTEFQIKQALDDPDLLDRVRGEDFHADDHVVEVVGRTLRMMGMIRTHPTLHEQYGRGRSVKDQLIRGNTLLEKLLHAGDKLMSPGHAGDPEAVVFEDIKETGTEMTKWVEQLDQAADGLTDRQALLGELGYVPEDVGLPVGGTGYGITLHERSERHPPDPDEEPKGDPSWTIGRQGRNNENMGEGWVDREFE